MAIRMTFGFDATIDLRYALDWSEENRIGPGLARQTVPVMQNYWRDARCRIRITKPYDQSEP